MAVELLLAGAIFAALAIYSPRIFDAMAPRAGRPHRHLVFVFRLWFGCLALGTLVLLLGQIHPRR